MHTHPHTQIHLYDLHTYESQSRASSDRTLNYIEQLSSARWFALVPSFLQTPFLPFFYIHSLVAAVLSRCLRGITMSATRIGRSSGTAIGSSPPIVGHYGESHWIERDAVMTIAAFFLCTSRCRSLCGSSPYSGIVYRCIVQRRVRARSRVAQKRGTRGWPLAAARHPKRQGIPVD